MGALAGRKPIAIGGAVALLAALAATGVVALRHRSAPPGGKQTSEPAAAARPGLWSSGALATQRGEHATYTLKYDARVDRERAPMIALKLSGTLEFWTVSSDQTGTLVRAQFKGQSASEIPDADATGASASLEQGFAQAVYLEFDSKGQMQGLRFHPNISRLAQTTWRSLAIAALQFVASDGDARVWQVSEQDENGNLIAQYDSTGTGGFDKRKLRYVSSYLPEVKHRVIESAQHFDFDGNRLPLRASESESVGVTTKTPGFGEMQSQVTLSLTRSAFEKFSPDPAWAKEAASFERLDLQASGTPRARQAALDEAMASRMSFDEAMIALQPGPDRKQKKEAADAYHALVGQLRLSDDLLPRLLTHIKRRGPLRATLLSVLRDAGTPSAQKALAALLDDADSNADDRARTVRDLSMVKTPTADTLHTLTSLMRDPSLGEQAELGVGANAYQLRESSPELAQQAVSTLVQDLHQASTDAQRRRAINALGNSGSASALPEIQPFLAGGAAATQVTATDSLRRMPGAQIDLLLADQLRHSLLPEVRIAAAGAIRYRDPTPPLVSALVEALHLEPDVRVRSAVLDVAIYFMPQSSRLRDAIADVARADLDPKLRGTAADALG